MFDARYTLNKKANLLANFTYSQLTLTGTIDGASSYELLNGLEEGKNLIWMVVVNFNVNKFIFLDINYNGRYSQKSDQAIHTGSATVRAYF